MLGDASYYYYRLKAEEFEARAEAEKHYQNIRHAYRKLAADYRKLADQVENAPPLVPEQEKLL